MAPTDAHVPVLAAVPGTPNTWVEFLDALEHEARRAAAATSSTTEAAQWPLPSVAWHPPSGLGPLPADLRDRARAVVHAQQEAATALRESMAAARRHRAALATVPSADAGHPVYLDVTG
ncbi:hypothetical protein EXU48_08030 [Occultella glacieicola]|uniref:Uncharacterized protein n=1 Tax=Occultella glacieicola TaxID=2518684 RepID=A0ABY2E7P9_9MICO|nr:hypothetical protein [Occultella glacieicola]TDE94737.1 hypothetical protein EXU48_08030 [Occultella glacieicola]